jgi:hyaluronate lyase
MADLPLGTASASVTTRFTRLNALATAYVTSTSPYYQNAEVLAAVVNGLDWMAANAYTASGTGYDNWWDWQIGAPAALNAAIASLYSSLTAGRWRTIWRRSTTTCPIRPCAPIWTAASSAGTSQSSDKAFVAVLRGVLGKSSAKIAAGRDAIGQTLAYVTSGDGFYADGSFVQHTHEPTWAPTARC